MRKNSLPSHWATVCVARFFVVCRDEGEKNNGARESV